MLKQDQNPRKNYFLSKCYMKVCNTFRKFQLLHEGTLMRRGPAKTVTLMNISTPKIPCFSWRWNRKRDMEGFLRRFYLFPGTFAVVRELAQMETCSVHVWKFFYYRKLSYTDQIWHVAAGGLRDNSEEVSYKVSG